MVLRQVQLKRIRELFDEEPNTLPARTRFYEAIRTGILEGVLSAGHQLSEAELCKCLSISRTPVREGLQKLESDGWVSRSAGRGLSVTGMTERDLRDLYLMRGALEALAIEMGVPVQEEQQPILKQMERVMVEMELHTSRGDLEAVQTKTKEFHSLMVRLSNSKALLNTLGAIYDQVERVRDGGLWGRGRLQKALDEHMVLFRAIKEGDAENGSRLAKEHIRSACDAMLARLKQQTQTYV